MGVRIFIDFDGTLYDTQQAREIVQDDLVRMGFSHEDIDRHAQSLLCGDGYSFEGHLKNLGCSEDVVRQKAAEYREMQSAGSRFLYADVLDGMKELKNIGECILLTCGNPSFQMAKYGGVPLLHPYFSHALFIWKRQTKGQAVQSYGHQHHTWFLDDRPEFLTDVIRCAPLVHCVRMVRDGWPYVPHADDDVVWPLVTKLQTFIGLVKDRL